GFWSRLSAALGAPVALKVAGEPARLGHWLTQLEHVARDGGVGLVAVGEAGSGVIRAALHRSGGDGMPSGTWLAGTVAGLRAALAPEGGSLVVERAPRAVKETLDVWGPVAPEVLDVMRRLKHEFDPAGILNPGRFAGGLWRARSTASTRRGWTGGGPACTAGSVFRSAPPIASWDRRWI